MSGRRKGQLSKKYIKAMRGYLRISSDALDSELIDLINAARSDLVLAGVHPDLAFDEKDPLVKRAVGTYVKAEFGLDNADAEKYRAAFGVIRDRMTLSTQYTEGKGA